MRKLNMKHGLTLIIFMVSLLVLNQASLAGTQDTDELKVIELTGTWSGSFHTTETDTDGNNAQATERVTLFGGGFKSNEGSGTFEAAVENPPVFPNPVGCPAGNVGIPNAVHENIVLRFRNGDLLFVNVPTHTGCADFNTLSFTFKEQGIITGGTGRFAGASGTFEDDTLAIALVLEPEFSFGSVSGEIKATIILNTPQ
jgi:hypothetical protein